MESETINRANLATVEWEDSLIRYCNFEDFEMEGGHVTSEFVGCTFRNVDWYWGIFNCNNFIDCTFDKCVFRGTAFYCRFVECQFIDCRFLKDNLDSDCNFGSCIAYGCTIVNCEGFAAESIGPPRRTDSVFPTPDPEA